MGFQQKGGVERARLSPEAAALADAADEAEEEGEQDERINHEDDDRNDAPRVAAVPPAVHRVPARSQARAKFQPRLRALRATNWRREANDSKRRGYATGTAPASPPHVCRD